MIRKCNAFFWRLNLYSAKYSEPISWQKKSKCWACSTHIYIKWIFDSECIYSFYKDKYECNERKYKTTNIPIRSRRQMNAKIVVMIFNGLWSVVWSVVVCGGLWYLDSPPWRDVFPPRVYTIHSFSLLESLHIWRYKDFLSRKKFL